MSLNKVMLIGNVGRDPEVRYLEGGSAQGGSKVATFTLATTERYRDRNGEMRENTEWHNIVAWRNSADIAEKYVKKGTQLYIEGKLRTRSWTDQAGVKKYTTEINVDTLQLLGKRPDSAAPQQGGYAASQPQNGYAPQAQGGYGAPQQAAYAAPQQQSFQQPSYTPPTPAQAAPVQQPAPAAPADFEADAGADDLPF